MDTDDISPQDYTYERAERIPGDEEVTLYFHRTTRITAQSKVVFPDTAAASAWALGQGFPDPVAAPGPAAGVASGTGAAAGTASPGPQGT